MAASPLELVQRSWAHFLATGNFDDELVSPDYVWDMSTFSGWPEQQVYHGREGAQQFIADWTAPFDDWSLEQEEAIDAGDGRVVVISRQHGRHRLTGMPVDMRLAQVFTVEDGVLLRMEMYADADEALAAVGVSR